jgi:outer membrane protein OmpA-like peptidoglycan-associated protein
VKTVEDIKDRKAAMMLFSPDHTVFEFMITNSRLTREEIGRVRKNTRFSPDDFTFGRRLFAEKKVDVACLWEPDVTLALESRPGAHRLFSTADASELVADVLLARRELLDKRPEVAAKIARIWFAGVKQGLEDKPAAARVISTEVPRFRDELGLDKTLAALDWVKWTDLSDNVRFFGLDGQPPAFDRVYNQADSIWINYPEAEIKDRFAPVTLRDDRVMRSIWDNAGRQVAGRDERYQPAVAATGDPLFTKPITINFRSAASGLDAESMAIINHQVLPQLEIARNMYIRVEGNTDSVGPELANRLLSERRAQAIVDYLITRGIDKERMSARGNGSSRPIASNKIADGRARNRRTDILFIPSARASR